MSKKKISKSKKTPKIKILKQIKELSNSVTKLLDAAKIKYKTIEHKVVFTAHDVSVTTKRKLNDIAKVVLVKVTLPRVTGGKERMEFVLVVLAAGKYLDFSGIKKALNAKNVGMANEKDITKYLKTKVGLLHPFGSEYNLKTLLDKNLSRAKKIVASAGDYTHSLELSMKDFEKLIKPIKGSFAKAKK